MPNLAQPPASLTTLIMAHGSEGVSCVGSIVKVLYRSGPRHRARRPGGHDGPPADPALTAGPRALTAGPGPDSRAPSGSAAAFWTPPLQDLCTPDSLNVIAGDQRVACPQVFFMLMG